MQTSFRSLNILFVAIIPLLSIPSRAGEALLPDGDFQSGPDNAIVGYNWVTINDGTPVKCGGNTGSIFEHLGPMDSWGAGRETVQDCSNIKFSKVSDVVIQAQNESSGRSIYLCKGLRPFSSVCLSNGWQE